MLFLVADQVDAGDLVTETGLLSGPGVEDDDEWSKYQTLPVLLLYSIPKHCVFVTMWLRGLTSVS